MEYRKAKDKAQFRREHESTLILYEAAAKALKEQGVKKLPDLYALKAEYKRLAEEKERLYEQYGEAKKQMQEYGIIKQNVDGILRVTPGKEWSQEPMSIPRMNYPRITRQRPGTLVREVLRTYCDGNVSAAGRWRRMCCVQSISYSLLCRWFRAAVLPLDAALCTEITKDRDVVKRCSECGAAFMPKSNRAKYCPACAKRMRRRKEAERQRKRYWQSTHLGP